MANAKKKVMVLFANDWDIDHFGQDKYHGQYEFVFYSRDLFHFPAYLQLAYFNVSTFLKHLIKKLKQEKGAAVLSILAPFWRAMAAKALGLAAGCP